MSDVLTATGGLLSQAEADHLATLSTPQLRTELADALGATAAQLARLACIVRLLEDRGEDLSTIRLGPMLTYLRRIAHGQLLPEVVVRFSSARLAMGKVSALALPDQRRLADGGGVELVVRRENGFDRRMADPAALSGAQLHQVFADGKIRSESEQIVYLEGRERESRPLPQVGKARADRARGGLLVGRIFVSQGDILAALSQLRDDESSGPEEQKLVVNLNEVEHRRIKVAAARGNTSMSDLARNALRAAGLI